MISDEEIDEALLANITDDPKKISWRAAQPDLAERGQREF